jgi:hypothetical protein
MSKIKSFFTSKNNIIITIAVLAIIITGVLILGGNTKLGNILKFNTLSAEEVAQKSIDYLNNSILKGQATATMNGFSEQDGFVKIKIKLGNSEFDAYATKDGKYLFPQAFVMTDSKNKPVANANNNNAEEPKTKKTCADIKKTDKPILDAFIVSKCPFGLQMQRVLADIIKNAPALTENIMVRYMGSISNGKISAMHGEEEAQENLRQICIRDEQRSKYWNYVSCHIKKGDVDSCLVSAGIDKAKLTACTTDVSRGLAYAKEDFDLQNKYEITGSPTLILGEEQVSEFDFGGRSSEGVKSVLCCGFKTTPGICSTKLNTTSAAASFSETYEKSGTGTSNSAAECQ